MRAGNGPSSYDDEGGPHGQAIVDVCSLVPKDQQSDGHAKSPVCSVTVQLGSNVLLVSGGQSDEEI